MASPHRRVIGYANPDGSGRGNWSATANSLLPRVVAHAARRIDEQVEAGDLGGASRTLRDHPPEVRDFILDALSERERATRRRA